MLALCVQQLLIRFFCFPNFVSSVCLGFSSFILFSVPVEFARCYGLAFDACFSACLVACGFSGVLFSYRVDFVHVGLPYETSFWFMHVDLFGHGFPMSVLPNVIWCIRWLSFTHGYDNGQIGVFSFSLLFQLLRPSILCSLYEPNVRVSNSLEASKLAINHPVAARQELNQRFFADLLCMLVCLMRFFPEEPLTSDHPKDEHNIINNVKQAIHLRSCGFHMTILRKFGPPLQWSIVPVGPGFHGKYVVQLWYRFLAKGDSLHGEELLFYYRPHKDIWGMVIRKQRNWGDNDGH
ncbi:hypothetical protein JHK82_031936 [Glycine max]|nr:hypothetical protein JHK82_031936 [Glycine max]